MRLLTEVDGTTRVVGVIGWPVRHSLSPPMQNAALEALGLNWIYVPFEVAPEQIPQALEGLRALNLVGLNVTVPHKEAVARLVDERSGAAQVLGAVNTIVNREGVLHGHNTDGEGFLRSLREAGEEVRDRRVTFIGAGGAARSVAYAVASAGAAAVTVVNRTPARARDVAELVSRNTPVQASVAALDSPEAKQAVWDAQMIIDCTPCGMFPHVDDAPAIPPEWLHEGQCVCDLVYTPRDTVLLKAARQAGARTVEGVGMLVHQGAIALELWTGQAAPVEVMRAALVQALEVREAVR